MWGWYYPTIRLEGIDGRPLDTQHSACEEDGGCSFTDDDDGFIYAFLAPSAIHAIQKHTLVGHLASLHEEEAAEPVRQQLAPLAFVMRWNLDLKHVEVLAEEQKAGGTTVGSQWGYAVSPANASSFNFSVELHSLASASTPSHHARLVLSIDGRDEGLDLPVVDVDVPRMGAVNASWVVDLAPHADSTGEVVLRVVATDLAASVGAGDLALPLVIRLMVGHWNCFSQGALHDPAQCTEGKMQSMWQRLTAFDCEVHVAPFVVFKCTNMSRG